MYRLLKLRKAYFCKTVTECAEGQYTSPARPCTLCTKLFTWETSTYSRLRTYHTNLEAAVQNTVKKKKILRLTKTASELLSVMENSTRQGRATVTKLKAKHISRLVDQPGTSLDQLHKLKLTVPNKTRAQQSRVTLVRNSQSDAANNKISPNLVFEKTCATTVTPIFHQFPYEDLQSEQAVDHMLPLAHESEVLGESGSESFEDVPLQGFAREMEHLQDHLENEDVESTDFSDALPSPQGTSSQSKKFQYKATKTAESKLWLARFKELEMDHTLRVEYQKIQARLRAVVDQGNTKTLTSMLGKLISPKKLSRSVKFVRSAGPLYDTVLEALARKGDLTGMLAVLKRMDESHVELTLKSYACIFECVTRHSLGVKGVGIAQQYIDEMKHRGLALNDIFLNVDFVRDQREVVLDAIQAVEPDFQPVFPKHDINYEVDLLKDINEFGSNTYISPAKGLLSNDEMKKLVEEQIKNEEEGFISIPNIWNNAMDPQKAERYKTIQTEVLDQWEKCLTIGVQRLYDKNVPNHMPDFAHTILKTLVTEDLVKILLRELTSRAETSELYSFPFSSLKVHLGERVKEKYDRAQRVENGVYEKARNLYQDYCHSYISEHESTDVRNPRHLWMKHLENNHDGATASMKTPSWPREDLYALGKSLYSLLLRDCKINANILKDKPAQMVPAFYTVFRAKNRRLVEELKPHPAVTRLFSSKNRQHLSIGVNMVPMVCPPVPWTSTKSGGHLLSPTAFIRPTPFTEVLRGHFYEKLEGVPNSNYHPCFDALNQLGSIPWRVNGKVLDVVIEVFTKGGDLDLAIPLAPSDSSIAPKLRPDMTREERSEAMKQAAAARRRRAENYALWCDALYRIALASHFRHRVIWLPHNMDFRGRVYPVAPYLQHMSGDMARSLLCFARGEPLGPKGLDWLKVHLVNLTGLKKRESIADRLVFADEMMPEILDSAKYPLTGRKWWMTSEEPWQTLAAAREIAAAIDSGNPESFISRFPVHQDGSCNGLQHYAALGRDAAGAKSVNLTSEDVPQDVYSCVAEIVERIRAKEAAEGSTVAKDLEGMVRRKVIKQTVMTTVYGVTRYGARLQIARQLNALKDFDKDKVWASSLYLTSKTFDSLNEMFTSTKEIQNWLTECAQLISQVRHECVEWTTPLGLPVVQPYCKSPSRKATKNASVLPISAVEDNATLKDIRVMSGFHWRFGAGRIRRPYVMKQRNAFPPNFIHSLDSTHMMLTALYCERAGITYVSVHDCFWVHPCNVDAMGKICRERFVALHSQPILENLSKSFCEKYGFHNANDDEEKKRMNNVLGTLPKRGSFDLREILKSVYFFS